MKKRKITDAMIKRWREQGIRDTLEWMQTALEFAQEAKVTHKNHKTHNRN